MTVLSRWFAIGVLQSLLEYIKSRSLVNLFATMCLKRRCFQKVENVEETQGLNLLDLPELALENIFSRLSPASLCSTAGVCRDLRRRCRSDHLWDIRIKAKWDKVAGVAARREWQRTVAVHKEEAFLDRGKSKSWFLSWSCIWPFSWLNSRLEVDRKLKSNSQGDSLMAWYLALERGNFWFPAQVYNRECKQLSSISPQPIESFPDGNGENKYPPHGPRTVVIEEGVHWDRIRAPPVNTSAHDLHVSDCLDALHPGDHVEVQWRRNREFPYGTAWLEFNQYTPGSRWRRAPINRKVHREEGSEAEGFYGGIRKLLTKEEILTWKQLWPKETLE